jgi:hypothetical protein
VLSFLDGMSGADSRYKVVLAVRKTECYVWELWQRADGERGGPSRFETVDKTQWVGIRANTLVTCQRVSDEVSWS